MLDQQCQQCRSTIWMPISRAFEASGRKHHSRYNGSGTEPSALGIRIRYHITKTGDIHGRVHCSRNPTGWLQPTHHCAEFPLQRSNKHRRVRLQSRTT